MSTLPPHALKPVVKISKSTTVLQAIKQMCDHKVGAVVVLEDDRLVGVFTERDVLIRVLLEERDPKTTPVADVMTRSVRTVSRDEDRNVARRMMVDNHIRHLPVVDANGKVVSMLSMRHLLRAEISDLEQTVWALVAEAQDSPGG
jgi:CBS domain-containing protein